MIRYNKEDFEYLKTERIILFIQNAHKKYEMMQRLKIEKGTKGSETKETLRVLRLIVLERLPKLDSTKIDFFPIYSLVGYENNGVKKTGKVIGWRPHTNQVLVMFDGEDYQTEVEPIHLKLLFMRNTY